MLRILVNRKLHWKEYFYTKKNDESIREEKIHQEVGDDLSACVLNLELA